MTEPGRPPPEDHDSTSLGDATIPDIVRTVAGAQPIELLWHNELGGLTFRTGDVVVKWNPRRTGVDLDREVAALHWLEGRHPAPEA